MYKPIKRKKSVHSKSYLEKKGFLGNIKRLSEAMDKPKQECKQIEKIEKDVEDEVYLRVDEFRQYVNVTPIVDKINQIIDYINKQH